MNVENNAAAADTHMESDQETENRAKEAYETTVRIRAARQQWESEQHAKLATPDGQSVFFQKIHHQTFHKGGHRKRGRHKRQPMGTKIKDFVDEDK